MRKVVVRLPPSHRESVLALFPCGFGLERVYSGMAMAFLSAHDVNAVVPLVWNDGESV